MEDPDVKVFFQVSSELFVFGTSDQLFYILCDDFTEIKNCPLNSNFAYSFSNPALYFDALQFDDETIYCLSIHQTSILQFQIRIHSIKKNNRANGILVTPKSKNLYSWKNQMPSGMNILPTGSCKTILSKRAIGSQYIIIVSYQINKFLLLYCSKDFKLTERTLDIIEAGSTPGLHPFFYFYEFEDRNKNILDKILTLKITNRNRSREIFVPNCVRTIKFFFGGFLIRLSNGDVFQFLQDGSKSKIMSSCSGMWIRKSNVSLLINNGSLYTASLPIAKQNQNLSSFSSSEAVLCQTLSACKSLGKERSKLKELRTLFENNRILTSLTTSSFAVKVFPEGASSRIKIDIANLTKHVFNNEYWSFSFVFSSYQSHSKIVQKVEVPPRLVDHWSLFLVLPRSFLSPQNLPLSIECFLSLQSQYLTNIYSSVIFKRYISAFDLLVLVEENLTPLANSKPRLDLLNEKRTFALSLISENNSLQPSRTFRTRLKPEISHSKFGHPDIKVWKRMRLFDTWDLTVKLLEVNEKNHLVEFKCNNLDLLRSLKASFEPEDTVEIDAAIRPNLNSLEKNFQQSSTQSYEELNFMIKDMYEALRNTVSIYLK